MKVVNTLDRQVWKKFVDEHPQGNIFHTPEMFEVFARTRGYRPTLWAVVDETGQVLALFSPVQITLLGGPLQFFTSRNIAYGSLLAVEGEIGQRALALLLKTYNQRVTGWPLMTELRNTSDLSGAQKTLGEAGYEYEEHLNYHIDLRRDLYDILQSFARSARNRIRQSLRRGVLRIEEVTEREQIALVYELFQKTYHLARIPLAHRSLFESAFELLIPKNMVRFTIAYIEETPVSSMASLLYKDVVYGWYHGSDRAFSSHSPNDFIYWDEIQWANRNGYRMVDMGGAGRPGESSGVRDFKSKFNGQLVSYGRNICVHAPWRFKLSQTAYDAARNVLASFASQSEHKGSVLAQPE